jgi:hypothetical protein
MKFRTALVAMTTFAVALTTASGQPPAQAAGTPSDEWRSFVASWSASGRRHTLPTETGRPAAIVQLTGAVVLTTRAQGLSIGFHAEAIAFDDVGTISAGRAVWTDRRGDQVFSVIRGEPLASRRRVLGTITGGTGAYAGITGDYELTWQYVIETPSGEVQGRTVDLKGRFRLSGVSP